MVGQCRLMVLEPEIIDLIQGDDTVFEKYPLEEAARRGQLDAYRQMVSGSVWIR